MNQKSGEFDSFCFNAMLHPVNSVLLLYSDQQTDN
jgi:hypothetical protein